MPTTSADILVIGQAARRYVSRIAKPSSCQVKTVPCAEACSDAFPTVVADAQFDFFDYLRFGETMLALRERVAAAGDLVLVRHPGTRDDYFVYRDDTFFRTEFPAAWEADFEHVEVVEQDGFLLLKAIRRRALEEANPLRAARPWGHLAHVFTYASHDLPPPEYAWIPATFRCNLRCRTCSVRNSPPGADISAELIDRIFDAVGQSLEVVNVTGIGEPLFSRTWPRLRLRIRERPYRRLEIVTNAMLLSEEEVRDMMRPEHPTILVISIDGARRETFEFIRDRARWDRLVQTMEMISRLRQELRPGPLFTLAVDFVAVKDNIAELPELIPQLAAWGVDMLIVIEMGDWVTNRDFYYEQALRFYPELANKYYDEARVIAARYPFRQVFIPPNYTLEAASATLAHRDARKGRAWARARQTLRPLYRAFTQSGAGRILGRAALALIEAYCSRPVGLPSSLKQRLQQQLAISRVEGFGEFRRVRGFCEVVARRAYFHIDGQIANCCGLMEPHFGNLKETDFSAIWSGPRWREFRLRNLFGFPHTACYYCTLSYGLPESNPENFMAAHRLAPGENRLARHLRRLRRDFPR